MAFQRAGEKLLRIRDERLYREEFSTFEDFCRGTYDFSKTYGNNLILAYNVVKDLADQMVVVLPNNERVARELAKYPKHDRKAIWIRSKQIASRKRLKNRTYKMIT
jgi:hypothetical protein